MDVLLAAVYNVFYVISYLQGLCDVVHISLASFSNRKTLQFCTYVIACGTFYGDYNTVNARQWNGIIFYEHLILSLNKITLFSVFINRRTLITEK
jgi:hypothetical protein